MDLGLSGQVAVVTGASRGIGLAIVRALAAEHVQVVAGARGTSKDLDELAGTGLVRTVTADLATAEGPARLIGAAGDRIDILVNNVGGAAVRTSGFLEITDEEWERTLNLNLMATVRTTRAALPRMLAAGRGSIVNICSVNSILPDPVVIDYCASKAAVANFSKALSKEVGGQGIRVNTVSPGPVTTDLWMGESGVAASLAQAGGMAAEDVVDAAARNSVTGRFTRPDEVADAVLLLASDRSGNTTGADITIDGGLITTW
ncbi:SDR family oxidoreductase [Streptosporangiaceae bacterium NEAU-GS5]|nr:SDR family oxidoreductase [Streptosporangiaceae bacterium NEAU-GS5]